MSAQQDEVQWAVWWCRRGHTSTQRADCTMVTCGTCSRDPSYHGTCEMRRRDLFPNWSKQKGDE